MADLEVRAVTVRYGAHTALCDVHLRVVEGERLALVGPNGSGKTTLLRVLAGILQPDEGEVLPLEGLDRRAIARRIAFLPQEEHWEFPFSVEDLVRCGRYARTTALYRDSPRDDAAVESALAAVGMTDLRARPITALSGGERRRAMLGRALAQEAPVLLLDEPTTALDLKHRHAVLRAFAALRGTVVLSTHDLDLAAAACPRVVMLAGGRVVADGPPGEVITVARLREVFGVDVRVVREEGRLHVVAPI